MVRQRSETPLWAAWLVFSVVGLPLDHVSAKHLSPIPDNCLTQYETQPWWNVDVKEYGRLAKYSGRLLQTETSVPKQQQAERLFEYSTALTEQMLRRGVSTLGDASRLRRAMHKLVSGQPVGVTVIGGSVSEGGGVWLTARSTDSYVGRIFSWIKSTFPGAKHRLHNGAIGGVASLYFAQCVDDFVPDEDVDLVIVEFTVNDRMVGLSGKAPEPDTSDRRGFEVLLRKLLSFKNRPAVLILHHWSVYVNAPNFFDSLEDVVNIVVQYYGLPALSFRNALYHSMMANVEGYQHQQVYCDAVHPNKLGHRYLADLVIGFLQDAAAEVLQKPLTDEDEQAALQPLPVPMYEGNLESSSSCLKANNFKTIVQDPVGWDWVDEGRDGRHKWGYVSKQPGSTLKLAVSTAGCANHEGDVVVGIGHLKSYEHMGIASVTCVSGCTCKPARVNGHQNETRTSQEFWQYLGVSQSPSCVLEVTSLTDTDSGEHKVKLTSLLVSCINPKDSDMRLPDPSKYGKFANPDTIYRRRLSEPARGFARRLTQYLAGHA